MIHKCSIFDENLIISKELTEELNNLDDIKIRINWQLGKKTGNGNWFDITSIEQLQSTVGEMNKNYGKGTHWLVFNI